MKQIISATFLALAMLSPANSFALSGGPFGNGTPEGVSADGTYNGVLSGKNLTGMVSFGINKSQETNGRFSVFHKGILSYGTASGVADVAARTIAGALMGVAALPAEATGASAVPTVTSQTITVRGGAEGIFDAKMKGFPANIIFEGKGRLSSIANTGSSVASTQTTVVGGVTTTTTTNSGSRETTSFRIRGSRTSNQQYVLTNSVASIPPRIPATPAPGTPAPATPAP